ncbi:uncharacterized mitochondrial protein AtMg00810-like [Capsicum annuum]|uniref:uncharacterized mitochondrial protein AtMg00810-like n=1 Tax=Capsicum annuum TaxID=4072 RepID=UPI001FB0F0FE|nr:uncharacterized mitochondrial protein AtMg00810-like [Capsicum annuum]
MLTQQKYASDLVATADLTDDKVVYTPMEIIRNIRRLMANHSVIPHCIGSCIHHTALLRVIRYVRGSMNQALLFYLDSSINLKGYTNANWAGCFDSHRSVTGWCMFLGTSLIS